MKKESILRVHVKGKFTAGEQGDILAAMDTYATQQTLELRAEIERLKGLLKKELHDKVIGEGFHEIAFTVRWLEYSRLHNL